MQMRVDRVRRGLDTIDDLLASDGQAAQRATLESLRALFAAEAHDPVSARSMSQGTAELF